MSQYQVHTHDPDYLAYCGWHPPRQSFFFTVEARNPKGQGRATSKKHIYRRASR
ncbi:hypothetical protein [Candidatus Cyanaurora vandensis]|uniref:hypothetical protein n=1 Tax=Candidatus Cyanaurora vandensis TaxID=2714958 RepID=UPI00257F269C|nr:hypothetical protein [Candidatus Cyanaurora vandensis]